MNAAHPHLWKVLLLLQREEAIASDRQARAKEKKIKRRYEQLLADKTIEMLQLRLTAEMQLPEDQLDLAAFLEAASKYAANF